ncbi:LIM-domain binding protein-domain-containing protein [Lyophyllum atratum]|nr:LIM-domain binding protein-domain-containing protein [Lyophyllum atratum]
MNGNVHPDMLRQGLPPQAMMSMNAPFMQNMSQSGQQQMSSAHLGLSSSSNPPNPAMMHNNPPGPMNSVQQQQFRLQMQQAGDGRHQRQVQMRQSQPGQPMMGPSGAPMSGGGGGPHMVGMPSGQTMNFNPNMMTQQPGNVGVRRVSSQPQMNQGSGPMGGMSPNVVNNNLAMGMSAQGNMPQMRQIPQGMQHPLRMGQGHMQNQMSPDMPMPMNRQGGNPGMPGRTGSAQSQLMNSLSHPPSMQHALGPHQNQFQSPVQIPSQHPQQVPSPRPGSHSQTHTPSMTMSTPGPSHTPVNRPQMNTDDPTMSFMNYSNPQFNQAQHTPRMQPGANDVPQPMSAGLGTPGSSGGRMGFPLTPAQQLEQMSNNSPEGFTPHFNMPPPSHVPPRPPSQLNPHAPLPQQQISHHSPHSSDSHMNSHPQRPQSQPQAIARPLSSQQAHTPRSAHPQIPPSGPPPNNRMGLPHHGQQPTSQMQIPVPGSGPQHLSIAPRPPPTQVPLPGPVPSNVAPPTQAPSDTPPSAAAAIPRQQASPFAHVGNGQGLIRLLNFSGVLAAEDKQNKLQLSWWSETIKEYFTPKAMLKFTLWKDNQRNEAKPFEIGVPILPRFFLVTTQSGVKSMTLSLDGARERQYGPGHSVVECVTAIWTYKYNNGYTVTLRGPLTVHVVVTSANPPGAARNAAPRDFVLKFEDFQFDANFHDKYIALESIVGPRTMGSPKTPRVRNTATPMANGTSSTSQQQQLQLEEDKKWEEPRVTIDAATIPGEPVNAFGIPQATMRCLELAESVSAMTDLISYSTEQNMGPLEALKQFASKIREMQPFNPPNLNNQSNPNMLPNPYAPMHSNPSNVPTTPAVTLYSSAPPSVTNPSGNSAPMHMVSPKNLPPSAGNSPQKQHKTIPQQTAGASSSSAPGSSPAVSSGANNTPALASASLKRKQAADTASPTTANSEQQPPAKRQTRRRRTTGAAGAGGGGG